MDGPSAAIIVAAVWGKSSDESEGALIASGRLSRLKIPENIIYQRFIGQRQARAYLLLFAAYNSNDVRGGSIDHLLWCGAEFDVCVLLESCSASHSYSIVISVNCSCHRQIVPKYFSCGLRSRQLRRLRFVCVSIDDVINRIGDIYDVK
jgi:hypothetical protein